MSSNHANFYFLSSGFCGTRFHYHALRLATNAEVWHQPGHEEISEITNLVEKLFGADPVGSLQFALEQFPRVRRRIDKRLSLPWIYGDTLNWMRGMGYMLYRYIGPERLRLVQLIRHPTATCRSILAHVRGPSPTDSSDVNLAEQIARRWVRQYAHIRYQFEAIADPGLCKTIKLEDNGLAQLRDLYSFLGLEGFDEPAIDRLLEEQRKEVRHSHLPEASVLASKEELLAIWRVCRPLAEQYGYREDETLYDEAPSRPVRHVSSEAMEDDGTRTPQPWVKLLDFRGLGLIIRSPSGIRYINQAGGPICFWLHAEGAFIPLVEAGEGTAGQRLFDHFHLRRDKTFMSQVNQTDADFIDGLLAEQGLGFITVNRARIGEEWDLFAWETWGDDIASAPWEAWVPVRVRPTAYDRLSGTVSGVDAEEAILVWENSN